MNSMSSKLSEKDSNRYIFRNFEGFHIPTKSDEGRTVPKPAEVRSYELANSALKSLIFVVALPG